VSIYTFDGQWLLAGEGVATSGDCCCDDPPPACSGSCDEETPCPEGCYCCDGVCQEEPCEEPCGEETLGDPCGDENPYDEDTDLGYQCCYNQLGELGCFLFPPGVYSCTEDEWCSQCGGSGGIETRIGPYDTFIEAAIAAQAWFNDNCSVGSTDARLCDGSDDWYGFICCTDEAP